jgi:hypothetical protein
MWCGVICGVRCDVMRPSYRRARTPTARVYNVYPLCLPVSFPLPVSDPCQNTALAIAVAVSVFPPNEAARATLVP